MIEINGVYNIDTIKMLENLGINKFSFDCRPKNFNFIQLHAITDLLSQISNQSKIGLLFDNEQALGIERIVDEVKKHYSGDIDLYFYGSNEKEYYDSIPYSFYWGFDQTYNFNHFYHNEKFKGFILDYRDIEPIDDISRQLEFLKKLAHDRVVKIQIDWNTAIAQSLFDFYNFDSIVLEVNNLIESSFRNIDTLKVKDHLQKLVKQLQQ